MISLNKKGFFFLENEEFEFIQMVTTSTDCDDIDSRNEVLSERLTKCEENKIN